MEEQIQYVCSTASPIAQDIETRKAIVKRVECPLKKIVSGSKMTGF